MKKILSNGTTLGSILGVLGSILCIVAEAVSAAGANSNTK